MTTDWEVLAIRFGTRMSTRAETFYRHHLYETPNGPLGLDYFFWVIRDGDQVILMDTGFNAAASVKKNRPMLIDPIDALAKLGIQPADVSKVVVSHFHFDHIGNLAAFPDATLVVQKKEFDFWTGYMGKKTAFNIASDEVDYLRQADKQGAIQIVDGDAKIAPGISLQLVGGHTPGQQIAHVEAEMKSVVLATDAMHYYEELASELVFVGCTDLPGTLDAYAVLRELEAGGKTLVAGHDPLVMERFDRISGNEDLGVRIG